MDFAGELAAYHMIAGCYEEAIEWADLALMETPRYEPALCNKVVAFAYLDRVEEAHAGLARPIEFQLGLSIGVVEDIIIALSQVGLFFVIACNSSFTYKGKPVDIKQIGRELRVRYVLEGSIRNAANRVRITGQLIEATTGHHIWADRFDGSLDDIFDLQDRLTESVVGSIAPMPSRPRT